MFDLSTARAEAAGLVVRPLAQTVREMLAWLDERGDVPLRTGLSPEREADLVARYQS